jgi:hypothetical protein
VAGIVGAAEGYAATGEHTMTSPEIQTKRYPIRGALYGFLLGISAAYFLYIQLAVFPFDSLGGVITRLVIIIVAGIVIGILWAYVAPARKPKGPAPVGDTPPPAPVADDEPPSTSEEPADDAAEGDEPMSEPNDGDGDGDD